MINLFFLEKPDYKAVLTLAIGLMSAIFVMLLTLNLMAALIVFVMSLLSLVFRSSFSRGWLLLLAVFLIFPSVKINQQGMLLSDFMLAALALIGLINLAAAKFKNPENNLFYEFFLLSLCGFSILSFGFILNQDINHDIWRITISLILMWITLVSFQYYFQTLRRIKRFFYILAIVGLFHSVFGLIMFLGNWQTASGMGISNGKNYSVTFGPVNHPINGFLGLGLDDRIRTNALAPLLMISINTSLGFLLIQRKKKMKSLVEEDDVWNEEMQSNQSRQLSLDILEEAKESEKSSREWIAQRYQTVKIYINKYLSYKEIVIITAIFIQIIALTLTYSEASLLFLGIGLLVFGILDRNRQLTAVSSVIIILFGLVLPSFNSSLSLTSNQLLEFGWQGHEAVRNNWLLGSGWQSLSPEDLAAGKKIHNSYLYVWNNFGLIGIAIVLVMLGKYFRDLYQGYRRSDGTKRIWMMVIIAIFIQLVLEAMIGNTLLYGPAALIFWLLYGAAINLRRKPVIHGLTETKLLDN